IVLRGIAHDSAIAHQFAADRLACADEARVVGRDKSEFGEKQDAGVEFVLVERANEGPFGIMPGALEDRFAQGRRAVVPKYGALAIAEPVRNLAKAVASRPADRGRMGMDALAAAIFPDPGVWLEREAHRSFAQRLQPAEERFVAHARQAFVDEHLRRREDGAAIDVVLMLLRGLIADSYRSLAEKPGKFGRDFF